MVETDSSQYPSKKICFPLPLNPLTSPHLTSSLRLCTVLFHLLPSDFYLRYNLFLAFHLCEMLSTLPHLIDEAVANARISADFHL